MSEVDIYKEISKKTPKEQFNWFWRNSKRESILNQFYYEHNDLITANKLIDKVNNDLITLIQTIMEQPSQNEEQDNWLLGRLEAIQKQLGEYNDE